MNEKLNIHEPNSNLTSRLEFVKNWNLNKSLIEDLKNFLEELGSGKINKGKHISKRTQVKYIDVLRPSLVYFNKPLEKITIPELEKFDKDLKTDIIKSTRGKPYSYNMKSDIRLSLKIFLSWKLGKDKALKMTEFFDTREIKKTPDYLKEQEVEKLFKACKSAQERYLLAVLFDSGARAEEFLNIRLEDIQMPEGKQEYVKITLKEEYSKTEGRTISLYWRYSLEAVRDFLNERMREGLKSKDCVINITYDALRAFLRRHSIRAIGKPVHCHLFRHSSATYYASKMNRQELCYRYGWKFSSDMPDVYISRSGILNKDLDEKFSATEINTLKDELEKEKQKNSIKIGELEGRLKKAITEDQLKEAFVKFMENKALIQKIKPHK